MRKKQLLKAFSLPGEKEGSAPKRGSRSEDPKTGESLAQAEKGKEASVVGT